MTAPRDAVTAFAASTRTSVSQITSAHSTQLAAAPLAGLVVRNSLGGRIHPATNARSR